MAADIRHAHYLLDQLGPGQLAAVVQLLENMISPEEDRETLSDAERKAVAQADEWLKHNQPIRHEEVLADFGLTMADWEKMGQEPVPEETPRRNS
jgi:O-succinylbenzoate synthase